ncbi:hypothetical protein F5Y18DRAFT_395043 [Xylariaceae sp. FL1019]|nr:hypothetical protein F5Y18DRAFT_395043 [Xylariaceae sp. FL1019]
MHHGVSRQILPSLINRTSIIRLSLSAPRLSYAPRRFMASSANPKPLTKRAVAGSFLFKYEGDEADGSQKVKVALFRRSEKVRTYQHKYAPLSGSVEESDASPLATALREINEETTLPASSLQLLRVGKPYSFVDDDINREWQINPFGFRLKGVHEGGVGEEGIKLDWEHEGWEWFDPADVIRRDGEGGVPKLANSLRRVWPEGDLGPEAGKVLNVGLRELAEDRESGARELAIVGVQTLRDVIERLGTTKGVGEDWWSVVRMSAWHICQARPAMGSAITSAVLKALDAVESIYRIDAPAEEKIRRILASLDEQLAARTDAAQLIRKSFSSYLIKHMIELRRLADSRLSILTLSSSSTIVKCLERITQELGIKLDIRILESRPLCEGVTLASKLAENGDAPKITIYSDAAVARAAQGVDLVLLGADRISSQGDVSNKVGSLPAVLAARHVAPKAQVVVLSDMDKIAEPQTLDEHHDEENDPSELTNAWNAVKGAREVAKKETIVVKNPYFEWVPANLINAYVTEQGTWNVDQISERAQWIAQEKKRLFDGV